MPLRSFNRVNSRVKSVIGKWEVNKGPVPIHPFKTSPFFFMAFKKTVVSGNLPIPVFNLAVGEFGLENRGARPRGPNGCSGAPMVTKHIDLWRFPPCSNKGVRSLGRMELVNLLLRSTSTDLLSVKMIFGE